MSQPPDGEKEDQKHPIDPIQTTHMATFPVPAPTFAILKCRFNTPAQAILVETLVRRWPVGNDQECFFFFRVPVRAQIGLKLIVLPETNRSIKPLAGLIDQIRNPTGGSKLTIRKPRLAGMLHTDTEEILPAILLAQFYHRQAAKRAITDNSTFSFSKMRHESLKQSLNTIP